MTSISRGGLNVQTALTSQKVTTALATMMVTVLGVFLTVSGATSDETLDRADEIEHEPQRSATATR